MKLIPILLVLFSLGACPAAAQEVDLDVEVTMDALDPGTRDYLVDFENKLKQYGFKDA